MEAMHAWSRVFNHVSHTWLVGAIWLVGTDFGESMAMGTIVG